MNIRLPIENVDSLVDIALSIRTDISYQRKVFKNPPRIIYTVRFTNLATASWKIQIHPMGDSAEITFPVRIKKPSYVVKYPGGSRIEIFEEGPFGKMGQPIYTHPIDKAIYDICNSIYHKVTLHEENSSNDSSRTQSSIVDSNPDAGQGALPQKPEKPVKPERGNNIDAWFDWYHAMNKAGYKMTFPVLAKESGYSRNTFKEAHGRYKLKLGIDLPND